MTVDIFYNSLDIYCALRVRHSVGNCGAYQGRKIRFLATRDSKSTGTNRHEYNQSYAYIIDAVTAMKVIFMH